MWPPVFPLEKGLVLWFPFDDRSGATAYDRSGKRNNGVLYGPTWVAGRRGSALSFDGVNDYVQIPHHSSLAPTNAITIMCWAYVKGLPPYPMWVAKEIPWVANKGYCFYPWVNRRWFLGLAINGAYVELRGNTQVILNTWAHCTGVFDGLKIKLYFNGLPDGETDAPGSITEGTEDLYVGALSSLAWLFQGILNEVRIYNRALSSAEIKRLYESELLLVRH